MTTQANDIPRDFLTGNAEASTETKFDSKNGVAITIRHFPSWWGAAVVHIGADQGITVDASKFLAESHAQPGMLCDYYDHVIARIARKCLTENKTGT